MLVSWRYFHTFTRLLMGVHQYMRVFVWLVPLAWGSYLQAQMSNIRSKKIAVSSLPVKIDTLSIVPGSLRVSLADTTTYRLDAAKATLWWNKQPAADSVQITYRVFPVSFSGKHYRYQYDSIANYFRVLPGKRPAGEKDPMNRAFDLGNITYTGSFGRSLSFGNTQDVVVNSLFNLQISGMLADSIELSAAITDNNIPIQPDGTTQQLNEFDRIWMQFKKRNWQVNIGDIDVRQQPNYFLGFFKRQQGLAIQTTNRISKTATNKLVASGAVAKGKFTRNIFQGAEGNQGPYRLRGANNELFFVVLAGTERVWIDGVQMQRGEDQDYVINYNSAEITFTPRQLINKDKRIQVEFEYADRNYLNALLFATDEINWKNKLIVSLSAYSNADAKNSPINQDLNANQKQFLANLGDSTDKAFYPSANRDSFSTSKILYVRVDTMVGANRYLAYRYEPAYDAALYSLSFTEVGQGRGDYVPLFNAANGKVYQWVAPVNGVKQGAYEPVAYLVAPKKLQMYATGVEYRISKNTTVKTEAAISINDVNTFSGKDKGNDAGYGLKAQVADTRPIGNAGQPLQLTSQAAYEYVSLSFRPLERLRTIEFLRDWGLPFDATSAEEKLPSASVALRNADKQSLQYAYNGYMRSDGYSGGKHTLTHFLNYKGWTLNDMFQYTSMKGTGFDGFFLRPRIEMGKTLERLARMEIGGYYLLEHNEVRHPALDTLLLNSFSFRDWSAWLCSNTAKPNKWYLNYFSRANKYPVGQEFVPIDVNHTFAAGAEFYKSANHQARVNGTYRILQVKTAGITTQQSENSLVGRGEYQMRIWKGAAVGSALYELGTGQEQQRDFSYIEVPAGRGEYAWIDYNADGVPQLNEFEVAQFPDQARYIRIFTPTNRFVRAAYTTLNYSLTLNPRAIWAREKSGIKQFLSKTVAQSSLQANKKQLSDGKPQFNPFAGSVEDSALISTANNLANSLSFNRFSTKWGLDLSQVRNQVRALLTYGFETRANREYSLRLRKNFGRTITTELNGRTGNNKLATPNPKFDNRNYIIEYYSLEPKIIYTKGATFRTQASYKYGHKDGVSGGEDLLSVSHAVNVEAKYNALQNAVINGKLTYSQITFDGEPNTTAGYIMLEGLQPGRNLLWSVDFTKRLANALELSFQYEGRKAGDTKTVHIGRAALRAIL